LYSWWREPTSEPDAPKRVWQVATNTLNKVSYQSLTRRYGIWKSSPLKELDAPVGTTGQPVRFGSDTKSNSLTQLAIYCPFWALTPSRFCSWWHEPHLIPTPQNTCDKLQPTLLIRSATNPSLANMGYENPAEILFLKFQGWNFY
jgi:hypothetical protein